MSTQTKQPKLRLPKGVPQPPTPPEGFRWEIIGWGNRENRLEGKTCIAWVEPIGWDDKISTGYSGIFEELFYILAVPLPAKPTAKRGKVKAHLGYVSHSEPGQAVVKVPGLRCTSTMLNKQMVAIIPLDDFDALVEQVTEAERAFEMRCDSGFEPGKFDFARAVLASIGLTQPKWRVKK